MDAVRSKTAAPGNWKQDLHFRPGVLNPNHRSQQVRPRPSLACLIKNEFRQGGRGRVKQKVIEKKKYIQKGTGVSSEKLATLGSLNPL